MTSRSEEVKSRLAAYRSEKQKATATADQKENIGTGVYVPSEDEANRDRSETIQTKNWWLTALKILLWMLVWGFFIEVEFGLVYVVLSGLVLIVLSLRGGRKRGPGELSAYSVFNKDFVAIEGTLSAEQFEKELRYGPTAVKK